MDFRRPRTGGEEFRGAAARRDMNTVERAAGLGLYRYLPFYLLLFVLLLSYCAFLCPFARFWFWFAPDYRRL